jgi:phenylacetate-coenzyme A ligase PaaK-like adenylate-forming protein
LSYALPTGHDLFLLPKGFEDMCMAIYLDQSRNNPVYKAFQQGLHIQPEAIRQITDIPFLPVELFKSHPIVNGTKEPEIVFSSSGTTGTVQSLHYVADLELYKQSFRRCFDLFYGPVTDYCILALLPSYLERKGSSLVLMAEDLIQRSGHPESGFYLNTPGELHTTLLRLEEKGTKTLLLGVTYALLDFAETHPVQLKNTVVMETGGMKGRRKEIVREEVHALLCKGFGMDTIHSEYGMTELLSQAYSTGKGLFSCPPWMKVLARDTSDPLAIAKQGATGGLNVIDLANIHSCSFIATQDLGKVYSDGRFEILGRFDNSDVRGCNLMVL